MGKEMTDAPESFDATTLGEWSSPRSFVVSGPGIAAYAAATNDLSPASVAGAVAPPAFAIVPAFGSGGGRSVIREDRRAELAGRLVHGEQWMVFHRPIAAGDELEVRGATVGIHAKSSGVTVVSKSETSSAAGLVNEQYVTIFYRGATSALDVGETAPTLRSVAGDEPGRLVAAVTYPVDADQPARYADAAGDHNRIHLDDDFARSVGLPGVIVHGMCTLAFAGRAARAALAEPNPAGLGMLGARFTRPLLPGDEVTTRVYALSAPGAVRFESFDGSGQLVLGAGYARTGAPT
jgi:acyl dehydratase